MSSRRLGFAVLAASLVTAAGCSQPDRSNAADELGRQLRGLPSISDVRVSYNPDTAGSNESLRMLVTTEPGAAPAVACAAVRTFVDRFPGTEIDAGQAHAEVRDDGGAVRWSFTVRGAVREGAEAERLCVASQQARTLEAAYAVRATAGSDGAKPGLIVNYRDGAIPSAQAGLEDARAAVAAFDQFSWSIYVVCGEALCDRATS